MRLLNRLVVSACVIACAELAGGSGRVKPVQIDTARPGPMDVLYYSPVNVNYSWGPKGADLARLTADTPASANIQVIYDTSTGAWPAQAQAAFQAAANIWANTLTTSTTIRVTAKFRSDLGTNVLGSAGPAAICGSSSAGFVASTWYAAALYDKLKGTGGACAQVATNAGFPTSTEINANFSSQFDWDYGTSGVGVAGKVNFMTVVLHEIGHGLGFFGDFTSYSGCGINPQVGQGPCSPPFSFPASNPEIFDRFVTNGNGGPLLLNTTSGTPLHSLLIGDNLFWNGTNASGAKIEAHNFATQWPNRGDDNGFLRGSSYSHLDDVVYSSTADGLMTWVLGNNEVYTAPGPVMKNIFKDIGWTIAAGTTPHTLGDYTGDGSADAAVFRPSSGQVFVNGVSPVSWGLPGDIPVVGDFNGDGRADIAVFRPSDGGWYVNGMAPIQWGVTSDVPVPGDYNGDGVTDAAIFRTFDGIAATWYIRGVDTLSFGLRGDIPMVADYDGDGKDDVAVFRPSEGRWYIRNSSNGTTTITPFGLPGDIPVVGKFDADARADLAVYRQANGVGTWFLSLSGGGAPVYTFGLSGDVPLARDVNGDGVMEIVVYRPANGTWYYFDRIASAAGSLQYGVLGDIPVHQRPRLPFAPGSDFDGDGRSDITVYRPSDQTWYTKTSDSGYQTNVIQQWGINGDIRVPGDYDGDRKTDYAVYRSSGGLGTWLIRRSSSATLLQVQFGLSSDVPMPADYDGDSITDIAVFRPSDASWYILKSSTGFTQWTALQWGAVGDTPIAADFDGDGRADVTVYRPSTRTWYIHPSSPTFGSLIQRQWGIAGDLAAPADFDGDGRADINVFRPSDATWYALDALLAVNMRPALGTQWGISTDTPVPHDYDGDNRADVTVFRPSQGQWWILQSSSGGLWFFSWGLPADGPVVRKSIQ